MSDEQRFYAHSREIKECREYQTIKEHAEGVADRVCRFSEAWCDEDFAKAIAYLHDVGKYQPTFQRRIRGESVKIPHAICGAKESSVYRLPDAAAYIIAGHHAGLPDRNSLNLKDKTEDYALYKKDLDVPYFAEESKLWKDAVSERGETAWKEYSFWIRMMFSCLVDADYLDTEAFCSLNPPQRGMAADFSDCLKKLNGYIDKLQVRAVTKTELARKVLREQIVSHVNEDANLYYMNMPTGSGKTLASMGFALERAIRKGKKRIIYVIPYTSIIDQNAKVFKDLFGDDVVLEHHCNFDYESCEDVSTAEKLQYSAENWDSSFVVTTNVQFFESIYGNKTGKLRKLHNISESIIVFDEVHMLPKGLFQPCLEAIRILTKRYGCEAVFLTATMPDFDEWLDKFKCSGLTTCNLIQDTSCFSAFERCRILNLGKTSEDEVLEKALECSNSLIVVNKRRTARELYERCPIKKYHLSTYMNHFDRESVIAAVKKSLAEGERFCLFSTSLIEAGVDLDFDVVFRELSGLDNLLQTAGRCNRSGKRNAYDSITYSFEFTDDSVIGKNERYSASAVFERFENVSSPDAIRFYFNKLYEIEEERMQENDFLYATPKGLHSDYAKRAKRFKTEDVNKTVADGCFSCYNFEGYAEKFKMIEGVSYPLLIIDERNRAEVESLLEQLRYSIFGKNIRRRLQKYIVSLRIYEMEKLRNAGVISSREGIDCLANKNYYNRETGICFEDENDYIF